jgi:hypothetical protein
MLEEHAVLRREHISETLKPSVRDIHHEHIVVAATHHNKVELAVEHALFVCDAEAAPKQAADVGG